MFNKKHTTLVIGSGGIKCAASLGLVKVFEEEGIHIDSVVGCSGGSIYGAGIAMGMDLLEIQKWSEFAWTKDLMQGYVTNLKASKDGTLKFNERSGLVDDSVLNARLRTILKDTTFSMLKKPLHVVATDLMNGEKVVISEGLVFNAIRASLALPLIFPPWEVNGRLLIDGNASDPLPVDIAIQEGAEIIIAMGFEMDYRNRLGSMTAVQEQLTSIYMNNVLRASYSFNNLAHHSEIFPVIPEFDGPVSMFDVHKIPMVVEKGAEATRKQVPHIKQMLESLV
jgi:NTE family protein